MSDDGDAWDGRCPECGNPKSSLHHEACSRVHSEDFVGVPWGSTGTPGVVHLFPADGSDTALCCGIRIWAIPHSQQATETPEWATLGAGQLRHVGSVARVRSVS